MTLLAHLRGNAVAYAALAVALTSGTAYAADRASIPNGSVTTKKLADNAVVSAKIKSRTITRSDLAPGVLPRGTELFARGLETGTPVPVPDSVVDATQIEVTSDSTMLVTYTADRFGATCGSGSAQVAIYLDGDPILSPDVSVQPAGDVAAVHVVAVEEVAAGEHELSLGANCTVGGITSGPSRGGRSWTAVLVPQ